MLDYKYRRKTHPELHNRNWVLTIVSGLLFILVVSGIVATWRYVGHDLYIIGSVIIPASIIALLLIAAAINVRKYIVKNAFGGILELLFWWRP